MSKLSTEDIKKLADLAKIEITIAEAENYLQDINNILGHLSMVGNAQIQGIDNKYLFENSVRSDSLENRDFDLNLIYQNIPSKTADNFVKVSKVINK